MSLDGGGGSPADVLFLFAHQDDEVGIATRIAYEVAAGNRVWCAYLTDGAFEVAASVRDAESVRQLRRLGVEADRIAFVGDADGRIADGTLMNALPRARALLRAWMTSTGVRFDRMFTLDWEGGHHDHDAVHLVALACARDMRIPNVYAFSLYNGYKRRLGFFRMISFVPGGQPSISRRLSTREALRAGMMIAAYPSQGRTWLGLGPGFFIRTVLRREERFRPADPRRVSSRPHVGPLLYETLFKQNAEELLETSAAFRFELCAETAAHQVDG